MELLYFLNHGKTGSDRDEFHRSGLFCEIYI